VTPSRGVTWCHPNESVCFASEFTKNTRQTIT